jgi:hypothetical protein
MRQSNAAKLEADGKVAENLSLRELTNAQRKWVLECGARYWGKNCLAIERLVEGRGAVTDVPDSADTPSGWRNKVEHNGNALTPVLVALPDWAADIGINGRLLVLQQNLANGAVNRPIGATQNWRDVDWIAAAFDHLTGASERRHEARHGPALSYAFRLTGIDQSLYDHAWVNRIFLLLRRWAAVNARQDENAMFGSCPCSEIVLTHDVDAIVKTPEIRLKQSMFHLLNSARALAKGRLRSAGRSVGRAARFGLGPGDFRTFSEVRKLEDAAGLRSTLHFYGGSPGLSRRSPTRILIDPAYDVTSREMRSVLKDFVDGGWTVGLHQSTAAWKDSVPMSRERARVADASGADITVCRQHWLRFSWAATWRAQQDAGLARDSTLGFNDRPGFRNGAALEFHPWCFQNDSPLKLSAVPMVFMDSHFYDYNQLSDNERGAVLRRWLTEVREVGGQATVNWHTHTITEVYGWGQGYRELIDALARCNITQI